MNEFKSRGNLLVYCEEGGPPGLVSLTTELLTCVSISIRCVSVFFNSKRQDARIIVGLFYETEARKVFCEVMCSPVHL